MQAGESGALVAGCEVTNSRSVTAVFGASGRVHWPVKASTLQWASLPSGHCLVGHSQCLEYLGTSLTDTFEVLPFIPLNHAMMLAWCHLGVSLHQWRNSQPKLRGKSIRDELCDIYVDVVYHLTGSLAVCSFRPTRIKGCGSLCAIACWQVCGCMGLRLTGNEWQIINFIFITNFILCIYFSERFLTACLVVWC